MGDLAALGVFSPASVEAFFFGRRTGLMLGRTPPLAMVTPWRSFPSSSSFLTARSTCRGLILVFLLSRAAFPASSSTCIPIQKIKIIREREREREVFGCRENVVQERNLNFESKNFVFVYETEKACDLKNLLFTHSPQFSRCPNKF